MKIALLKDIFLQKINFASKFTSSKLVSSSALQGVCLMGEENLIHLYSTNLNYFYHSIIKLEGKHSFKIIIEPKKISEFLGLVSASKIDIEIKDKQIIIEAEKTKAEFPLFDPKEFPFPPKVVGDPQKIKSSFLTKNLPLLLFSSSQDETRPVLTGIDFVSEEDGLKIVSTDGFRLSLLSLKKDVNFPSMIVPSSFLSELIRLIDGDEVSFNYSQEEKILAFHTKEHDLYTRLIDGDYPPFNKVIPQDKKTTITLDREDFLRNVKLVSIFAREFSNVVILKTDKNEISLSPKTGGTEANITHQEAQITGEEQKIAFNYKFLIDYLNNSDSKKISIDLLRGDAPAVFKSEGVDNLIHIIMPVRIQE